MNVFDNRKGGKKPALGTAIKEEEFFFTGAKGGQLVIRLLGITRVVGSIALLRNDVFQMFVSCLSHLTRQTPSPIPKWHQITLRDIYNDVAKI